MANRRNRGSDCSRGVWTAGREGEREWFVSLPVMKVLIADDERLSRRALRAHLEELPGVRVVAECADGGTTLAAIEREEPDLVFLDIEMPRLSGFEVLARLPEPRPGVVFVTAYDEHAIRAFEVRALDYLLKPFDRERVRRAVEHAVERRREHELSTRMEQLIEQTASGGHAGRGGGASAARRILVREARRSFFVATADIDWIEALGNDVRLHVGKAAHVVHAGLAEVERQLNPAEFMRIHRSTIVNLGRVRHVEPYGGSDYQVVLQDGTTLRVSRSCRDRLLRNFA